MDYCLCRNRLNWPKGASSRKSVSAVQKLASLRKLLQDLGDPSVGLSASCLEHNKAFALCVSLHSMLMVVAGLMTSSTSDSCQKP